MYERGIDAGIAVIPIAPVVQASDRRFPEWLARPSRPRRSSTAADPSIFESIFDDAVRALSEFHPI